MAKKTKTKVKSTPKKNKTPDKLLDRIRKQQYEEPIAPPTKEKAPIVIVPAGTITTLMQCPPGTRFRVVDGWSTGILLKVNPCRSRVLLDAVPTNTIYVTPRGKAHRIPPEPMQEDNWSSHVMVEVTEAASLEFDPTTVRGKSTKETKAEKRVVENEKKEPVTKDKWGYRSTSDCAKINAILTDKWMSLSKIQRLSGASASLTYSHLRSLELKGRVAFNRVMKVAKLCASSDAKDSVRSASEVPKQSGSKTARKTKKARKK